MQSSSTEGDIGSEGEGTCPVSKATRPTLTSSGLDSLDEDDPNILLAIQLSLQDSRMGEIGSSHDILTNEASLGTIGTSLPSRLEQSAPGVEVLPRASLSSSELLERGDNLARLGNISSQYSPGPGGPISVQHCDIRRWAQKPAAPDGSSSSAGLFSCSTEMTDSATCGSNDPSSSSTLTTNANLIGNIMAWFHDMNPQGITLVPPTSSNPDSSMGPLVEGREGCLQDEKGGFIIFTDGRKPQEAMTEVGFCTQRSSDMEEKECAVAERPTQLNLVGLDTMQLPNMAAPDKSGEQTERKGSKACHVDTPRSDYASDQLPSTSSSEWEDHVHLV
ncbi:hypothetical protein CRENBAI_001385 [Crenichthys baileyi]|uniref:Uncharacterized protein n=1 Tax=Crenichthys baileyi TaxID=28760 RepID=A0AAV9QSL0_9TELE